MATDALARWIAMLSAVIVLPLNDRYVLEVDAWGGGGGGGGDIGHIAVDTWNAFVRS